MSMCFARGDWNRNANAWLMIEWSICSSAYETGASHKVPEVRVDQCFRRYSLDCGVSEGGEGVVHVSCVGRNNRSQSMAPTGCEEVSRRAAEVVG